MGPAGPIAAQGPLLQVTAMTCNTAVRLRVWPLSISPNALDFDLTCNTAVGLRV